MVNPKQLLLLSLLLSSKKIYLKEEKSETNFLNHLQQPTQQRNEIETDSSEEGSQESEEYFHNLTKIFTKTELDELKIPLQEQLKKINTKKDISENLREIQRANALMFNIFLSIKNIEYNISPIFTLSPEEMRNLQYSDFQYIPDNNNAKSKIEELSENKLSLMIETAKELIYQKNSGLDSLKLNNSEKEELKKFRENIERLENYFSRILSLKKNKDISEADLYKLASTYNMNFNGAEEFLLYKSLFSDKEKRNIYATNISHYWRNYVAAKNEKIKTEFNINKKEYSSKIEEIGQLFSKLYTYNEFFLYDQDINITELLKFLVKKKATEEDELSQKNNNTNNLLIRQLHKEKKIAIYTESNEALKNLLIAQGNTSASINKQENLGTQKLSGIEKSFIAHKFGNRFDWEKLKTAILQYNIERNENKIDGKSFREFEIKNKKKLLAKFGKIDAQIKYIYENLFNPKYISINKNKIEVSPHFWTMMVPYFEKYQAIEEYATNINLNNPLALNLYCMNEFNKETNSTNYALNALQKIKYTPNIVCHLFREPLNKLIHENLKESSKIIIDNSIETIKIVSPKILIPGFSQYEGNFEIESKKNDYIGINGKGGSGKTQLAMSLFTEFLLASRFGYSIASQVFMNQGYNFNDKLYLFIKNTGDTNIDKTLEDQLPDKYKNEFEGFQSKKRLSGSQTNYLKILRAARLALESENHTTVLLDETTSTVDEHTVKHILTSVPAVKDAISKGLFEVIIIDHNKQSRRKIASEEIQLNFKFVETSKPTHGSITDKLFDQIIITEEENPEIFNHIIDEKFFGSNTNKTAELIYFEINEKENILYKINEEKYNKIIAKFPNKVLSFSYIPRLNNPNNPKDRTGNITYEYSNKAILFENQGIIFKKGDMEIFAKIVINPKMINGFINYEVPDKICFWHTKNLKKTNSEINLISTSEMQSQNSLLENEQPNILDLVGAATSEEISASITDYYEEKIKEIESK